MRIGGSFPINIAKAYNFGAAKPAVVGPAAPPSAMKAIDKLVAGKTNQPVDFDAPAAPFASGATNPLRGPSLQLYTRAADRIEAAVGVALGKSLDVRG